MYKCTWFWALRYGKLLQEGLILRFLRIVEPGVHTKAKATKKNKNSGRKLELSTIMIIQFVWQIWKTLKISLPAAEKCCSEYAPEMWIL